MLQIDTLAPRMSSREIAELTGKRHDNVMADVRKMLLQLHGEEGVLRFQETDVNPNNGQTYLLFVLPKRETLILVSGYSVPMRACIIDRWQELEGERPTLNLRDPKQLITVAMQLVEVNEELQAQVKGMQVTVDAHKRIADAGGSSSITDTAKTLQVRPRELSAWLEERRWVYRRGDASNLSAYQDKIQQGLLVHKVITIVLPDRCDKVVEYVHVTRKGLAKLAEHFATEPMRCRSAAHTA
jgi:phage regulator Rha-like protein